MVFSSMIFLCIFLPVTFGLHLLLPGMRAKNMLLVIASLLFYAYGEPVYVLLLIGSSFFNYLFAWLVERDPGHKKVWVVAAVLANLAVLIIFKYTGFLISSFNSITGAAVPVPQIRMPIGISFFTFQALSYVIDVYRGTTKAQKNYWQEYLLYVSFFPQLIAGPIVKYHDIAGRGKLTTGPRHWRELSQGIRRFAAGLCKKGPDSPIPWDLWQTSLFRCVCSESQIDMPGSMGWVPFPICCRFISISADTATWRSDWAGCLVFISKRTFNYPYISGSIREFWRRWHISLSGWFQGISCTYPLAATEKGRTSTVDQQDDRIPVLPVSGTEQPVNFLFWGVYHGLFPYAGGVCTVPL